MREPLVQARVREGQGERLWEDPGPGTQTGRPPRCGGSAHPQRGEGHPARYPRASGLFVGVAGGGPVRWPGAGDRGSPSAADDPVPVLRLGARRGSCRMTAQQLPYPRQRGVLGAPHLPQ